MAVGKGSVAAVGSGVVSGLGSGVVSRVGSTDGLASGVGFVTGAVGSAVEAWTGVGTVVSRVGSWSRAGVKVGAAHAIDSANANDNTLAIKILKPSGRIPVESVWYLWSRLFRFRILT